MSTSPASRHPPTPPPSDESGIAGRIGPDPDAYDALADMFLGELGAPEQHAPLALARASAAPQRSAEAATSGRAGIELLILGHLPVMASAWASHYVRHAAGRLGGAVASLRLADNAAWLDLIGAPAAVSGARTLNGALRAASVAQHWIIRTDAGRERALVEHQRVTQVTLLTGCNEAATVDAYRAIKQLSAEAERLPAVRIAVLGGTAAACRQAADRICDACHAFLDMEIEAITCPGAIGAGPGGAELYHGAMEGDERLILDRLGELRVRGGLPVDAPAMADAAEEAGTAGDDVEPGRQEDAAALAGAEMNATAAGVILDVPRPEELGLRSLGAACPYEPSVQLATDEAGGLHLVVQATEAGQIDAAVRALSIVSAWAADHRLLLGAAGACAEGRAIQRHLLTGAPREARRLLDTDIRIHLCASAERAQHGWVLADLN